MGELLSTYEAVFSPDYWSPIPAPIESKCKFEVTKLIDVAKANGYTAVSLNSETRTRLENLLSTATQNLLNGQEVDRIVEDELIGSSDDKRYAIPGNVLLIDKEQLCLSRDWNIPRQDQDTTFRNENEVEAVPIALFTNQYHELTERQTIAPILGKLMTAIGLDNIDKKSTSNPRGFLKPYSKHFSIRGEGMYSRSINLFAFSPNKKGKTVGLGMSEFMYDQDEGVAITSTDQLLAERFYPIGRVGETINLSVAGSQLTEYTRIKAAYVCLRGTLEYAKNKKCHNRIIQKSPSLIPALVR